MFKIITIIKNEIRLTKEFFKNRRKPVVDPEAEVKVHTTRIGGKMCNICTFKNANLAPMNGTIAYTVKTYNAIGQEVFVFYTDHIFEKLSTNAKRFTLIHEQGHIVYGLFTLTGERFVYDEAMADKYAIEQMGLENVVEAMEEIRLHVGFVGAREMKERINIALNSKLYRVKSEEELAI